MVGGLSGWLVVLTSLKNMSPSFPLTNSYFSSLLKPPSHHQPGSFSAKNVAPRQAQHPPRLAVHNPQTAEHLPCMHKRKRIFQPCFSVITALVGGWEHDYFFPQ
jgi:hypothetical protein